MIKDSYQVCEIRPGFLLQGLIGVKEINVLVVISVVHIDKYVDLKMLTKRGIMSIRFHESFVISQTDKAAAKVIGVV